MITSSAPPRQFSPSGWSLLQPRSRSYPRISTDIDCDFCVVGAGWSGLAAAHRLATSNPDSRIVLVDGGAIGSGAGGSNSGFLFDVPFVFSDDAYKGREDEGRFEIRLYREVINGIRKLVKSHNIECGWSEIGQYHVAAGKQGERDLGVIEKSLMNLGEEHVVYGGLEIADRLGTDYYTRAIHTPGTVQINPFALLNGIVTSLPESISVYENSPVHTIDEDRPVRVRCDGGTVSAGRCLVTSNTHLRAFIGSSANLIPLMTFAAITKPLGPKQAVGRQDNSIWGVVPSSLFGTSMRRLGDDRLLVRNTYAFAADYNVPERIWARAQDRLRVSLQRRFPDAGNIEIEHTWGGLVSTFRDAKGFFGQIDKGIFAATASGMPVSILYGQQLAELVLGNDSETLGFVRRYSNPGRLLPDPWFGMFASSGLALQQIRACREI